MVLEIDVQLPVDGVKLQISNAVAFISNDSYGTGTLCVAERYFYDSFKQTHV
jgi:hypothetical protein